MLAHNPGMTVKVDNSLLKVLKKLDGQSDGSILMCMHMTIPYHTQNVRSLCFIVNFIYISKLFTGPRSAVGNVSGYRCVSDCRSRGREFDPGPVSYFRGD